MRSGPATQYVAVLSADSEAICCVLPRHVTARSPPENAALLIPSPWYTSGKYK
ncbi:hypothetical protein KPK_A0170 (plasmid) [Klebsiella variicola]|uniref:Uncharacterized protein n=1 Tax=Klebsiella variicola (strain 342) TaxID=507522 RepID=B5RK91_KLEV3|nr:hypothetical protein KPK_A0170 [Klebsiella variicola]